MKAIQRTGGLWVVAGGAAILLFAIVGCGFFRDAPPANSVTIESTPVSEADVTIAGVPYGKTPVTVPGLPPGNVYVMLEKEGYKRSVENITVPPKGEAKFSIVMEPQVGYLSVDSEPTGAKVYLDGRTLLGVTPFVGKPLRVGVHTYTIEAERRQTETKTFEVQEYYRYTFKHLLQPTPAKLIVFSTPSNAHIWLNDQQQAPTTPATFELPPGHYTVSVFAKGYVGTEQSLTLVASEEHKVELTMLPGEVPPGMLLIPAGEFLMGLDGPSPDERPQRKLNLDAFYIDKNEVTNADFQKVFPKYEFKDGDEQMPAAGVTYEEAAEYAHAVGKRLPTEPEWEKAARGTDGREYPWGNDFDPTRCNCNKSGFDRCTSIGKFYGGASPYGCLDMAGNVYEWTSSWYEAYPGNKDIETNYGQDFRVLRGGSYLTGQFELRCARRHYDRMDVGKPDYGFRCAADVAADPKGKKPAP